MKTHSQIFRGFPAERLPLGFKEPYLLFYLHNKSYQELVGSSDLDEDQQARVKLLCQWMEDNWRSDWDEADALLSMGKINSKHYPKLFRPDEIIVKMGDESKAPSGLSSPTDPNKSRIQALKVEPYPWTDEKSESADNFCWTFNGTFKKQGWRLGFGEIAKKFLFKTDGEVDILSLDIYPLRFAAAGLYEKLLGRGERFWACRNKNLICYKAENADFNETEQRCMVDYEMFRRMHPNKPMFMDTTDDLCPEGMESNHPSKGDFLALLPAYIHSFNLVAKCWVRLQVDRITDVTWNKTAFKKLVVPNETKELFQALVTAQSDRVNAVHDIIPSKGNGLLILLHGGPGTGKTLTAESIAEQQERPLYRVMCGDIGMEPERVESYLEATLHIGKAWGCVVLLDEADVFIEERSMTDMKRNALISVFLRVLEYYDGILILTTNRVGSFDEAFKSRIQLALRYPNLDQEQRQEIWRNFFNLLLSSKANANVDDLEMNVQQLATIELNGRQIRNAVTTARHLARFRKERMVYRHLQHAISTVTKFEEYLIEVKGTSDEVWARVGALR